MRLIDFDRYHFLLPNQYPRSITVRGPSNLSAIWHNVFKGLLPWYHNILYFYHVLDMISRPLSEKSLLDRVGQENVLKASAIPVYDLSAMTAKRIGSYWVRQANPFLSILPGDLQTVFIDPQVRELEELGVEIRYDSDVSGVVMHEGTVAAITLRDGTEVSGVYGGCCLRRPGDCASNSHRQRTDPIASDCSDAAGVATLVAGVRPHTVDPVGAVAGVIAWLKKNSHHSAVRFAHPPRSNSEVQL